MQAFNIIAPTAPNPGRDTAPKGDVGKLDAEGERASGTGDSFEDAVRREAKRDSDDASVPDEKHTPAAGKDVAARQDPAHGEQDVAPDAELKPPATAEEAFADALPLAHDADATIPQTQLPNAAKLDGEVPAKPVSTPTIAAPVQLTEGAAGPETAAQETPRAAVGLAGSELLARQDAAPAQAQVARAHVAQGQSAEAPATMPVRQADVTGQHQPQQGSEKQSGAPEKFHAEQVETTPRQVTAAERTSSAASATPPNQVISTTAPAAIDSQISQASVSPESKEAAETRVLEAVSSASETRSTDAARANVARAEVARPDLARHVSQQLVDSVQRTREGSFEIALSPEELGRVRLTLTPTETGLHLNLSSERPETLELLRRHIASLQQEFAALGYGDIDFDFGPSKGDGDSDARQAGSTHGADATDLGEGATNIPVQRLALDGGLDLRL